jgi:cyclic dehypoxanthinyl futalosine synthase
MISQDLIKQIKSGQRLNLHEAFQLWSGASLAELMQLADQVRQQKHPGNKVSWIIDRNVNLTNVCFSHCLFCNFCVKKSDPDAYVLSLNDYRKKVEELFELGGDQLLLQGGMHPGLGLDFYTNLFRNLKEEFPELKLHALGPPEIVWLAKQSRKTYAEVLEILTSAGLDSLPGAGAEILSDRVRTIVSPGKATSQQWLDVMHEAHKLGMITTATMMFGFLESAKERIEHLFKIRDLQDQKPDGSPGFVAFIPWPYQRSNTRLFEQYPHMSEVYPAEYLRMIALSRILLPNVPNIQASWLTVGQDTASIALHSGANDLGSVMIEEHVVSAAGAHYTLSPDGMKNLITSAGFEPVRRNQKYEYLTN